MDTRLDAAAPIDDLEDRDGAQAAVDLFGNPVSAAVASYKLDATGSLYESHSPDTEVPRLASPKT